jgi:hypothetical protein
VKLRFRRDYDAIVAAVDAATDWLHPVFPTPEVLGCSIVVPACPETVDRLASEFLKHGLPALAARLQEEVRWTKR